MREKTSINKRLLKKQVGINPDSREKRPPDQVDRGMNEQMLQLSRFLYIQYGCM